MLFLSGNNSFTGGVTISGNVKFDSDQALGLGALGFTAGRLESTFNWTTNRAIYPSSNASVSTGTFDTVWNGPVLGKGWVAKYGTGRLTIRDARKFFGSVLLQQGTLEINGSVPLGEAGGWGDRILIGGGTTLIGTGTWERKIISSGTLSPGMGPGRLSALDVNLDSGSTLALEIASASSFDQLVVRGLFQLTGAVNLTIDLSFDPLDNVDSFLVVDNDGTDAITGALPHHFRFAGNELHEGETFFVGSQLMRLSYVGGDGNDVVISAAPEPHSVILMLTALPFLITRRRKSQESPTH